METQKPHPSALAYGVAAALCASVLITAIETFDWKLSRIFNRTDSQLTATAALPPPALLETSYEIATP